VQTVEYEEKAINTHLKLPHLTEHMGALVRALRAVVPFDEPHVEAAVRQTAEQQDIKAAPLIHATRVAVTGRTASPGLFEVLVLLGRERTVERLERLATYLASKT
jgi:glutamyl-tRNA synthetase